MADDVLRARAFSITVTTDGNAIQDIVLPAAIDRSEVPAPATSTRCSSRSWPTPMADGVYDADGNDHDWKVRCPRTVGCVFRTTRTVRAADTATT